MRVLNWALDAQKTTAGKIVSVILSFALIFSLSTWSANAFAAENEEPPTTSEKMIDAQENEVLVEEESDVNGPESEASTKGEQNETLGTSGTSETEDVINDPKDEEGNEGIMLMSAVDTKSYANNGARATRVPVYLYLQIPNGVNLGQGSANEHNYYTIGKVQVDNIPSSAGVGPHNEYLSTVTNQLENGTLDRFQGNNEIPFDQIKWTLLLVSSGADEYGVSGYCWHLDGEVKSYPVTYSWSGITGSTEGLTLPVVSNPVYYSQNYAVDTTFTNASTFTNEYGTWTFSGWDKSGTINVTNDTEIKGTWTQTTAAYYSYVVKYLDAETGAEIAKTKTVEGQTFGQTVSETAEAIDGYTVDFSTKNVKIAADKNEITFYYTAKQDAGYKVNYLEQGTDKVLATQKVVDNATFAAEYEESPVAIDGYTVVNPAAQTVTASYKGDEITFYYTARTDLSYMVKYVDEDRNEIAKTKTVNDQAFGASVTEYAIDITGYVKPTEAKSITIAVENNEIVFEYTKRTDLDLTIRYLEKNSGDTLLSNDVTRNHKYAESTEVYAKTIPGYKVVGDQSQQVKISANSDENVVTFYYEADFSNVKASGVDTTYDGKRHSIALEGVLTSDEISYLDENGNAINSSSIDVVDKIVSIKVKRGNTPHVIDNVSLKIAPRELKVTTPSASKTYDGTALVAEEGSSIEGFVPGQEKSVTFSTTGTQTAAGSSSNTYDLNWHGTAKPTNYTITENLGTLTVIPQSINPDDPVNPQPVDPTDPNGPVDPNQPVYSDVTVNDPVNVVYNGLDQAWVPTVTDAAGTALAVDSDYTVAYDADTTNAGTIIVTITGTGNYAGSVTRTYQITPAPLTVTTPDATKVYDGTALAAAGTIEGFVNGETASFITTGTQTEAGTSQNGYSIDWNGTAKQGNYAITETLGTLTVTAAPEEEPTPTPGPTDPIDPTPNPTPVPDPQPTPTPTPEGGATTTPAAPAATTPAAPAPAAPAAATVDDGPVAPAADAADASTVIPDDENPLAAPETEIADNENPLAAFDTPQCWVHYWMIFGIILTVIYGAAVIVRRLGYARKIDKFDKDITGTATTSQTAPSNHSVAHHV